MKGYYEIIVKIFQRFLIPFGIGVGACVIFFYYHPIPTQGATRAFRLNQDDYPLVKPLLICNTYPTNINQNKQLTDEVDNFVNARISAGQAENISVYIIDYTAGTIVAINENERYNPASMLKVPLMIAYYQLAEKNPALLSQTLSYTGQNQNSGEYFKPLHTVTPGQVYSVNQLISDMIIYSDNTALALLQHFVDARSLADIYNDLDLPTPPNDPSVEYLSARSFASFFRILYNATYLTHADSQKALELLSQTKFSEGIRNGVPAQITVADKFGERSVYNEKNVLVNRELHDCGIVYKPGYPYLLCIMSRGKDFNVLAKNIRDLSTLVYTKIGQ